MSSLKRAARPADTILMTDLSQYETCTFRQRTDDDGDAMQPDLVECGTCGFQWCSRCHSAPSARSWCEGSTQHAEAARRLDARDELRDIEAMRAKGYTVIATDEERLRDIAAGRMVAP
jgi:hypothetical protein